MKFRFYLTNGQLYSFWVSPDLTGASDGYVAAGGPGFSTAMDTVGSSVLANHLTVELLSKEQQMDTSSIHGSQTDTVAPESRVQDLLRPEVLQAFDRTFFEREGYWVWEGILTDAGRKRWTESLQKLQQMNDEIVMDTDWAAIDFAGRGLQPPLPEQITPEFLATCCGGSEQMRFMPRGLMQYMREHWTVRSRFSVGDTRVRVAGNHAGTFLDWIRRLHQGCRHRPPSDDGALQQTFR